MSHQSIPPDAFPATFGQSTELSSVALGGKIVKVSDEFFAEAFHLLVVEPAPSLKGQFGPNGALYSGWETRRHNPTFDWCIIRLGTTGTIVGFDIDTSHFNGNEAPGVSVDALLAPNSDSEPDLTNATWIEILPKVPLGPSSRHFFKIPETTRFNYVKLNMYPDGGIARFRVYGHVAPVQPDEDSVSFDMAHVFAGGRVVYTSDQHFGVGSNLTLPGRGKDMSDGWETKRSRQQGHKDWVIIQLRVGATGRVQVAEIDTANFKGNFPESCELHGCYMAEGNVPPSDSELWVPVLSRVKLGPHRRQFFQLETNPEDVFNHVKLTIYPDGGIKRVRIIGTRGAGGLDTAAIVSGEGLVDTGTEQVSARNVGRIVNDVTKAKVIPVLPLTHEAFAPYGQVIQAYGDHAAAPRGTKITPANGGTAAKFHKLALVRASYPEGVGATSGLSVYRCQPVSVVNGRVRLGVLERHPYTNQAFVPMGGGGIEGDDAIKDPGRRYLVVVALNGRDDGPDLKSVRAFVASAGQGVVYGTGIWHQPMTVLDKAMDFTCVETQIGNGEQADCEVVEMDEVVELQL
ncbi:galactose-binding domain-like protein [Boletus reticuloceps]|uniref:Galactose-binding domain-like protein n=1 Tax=Boletus reticuloceps TaxID=495285 RepID=A0A8I2YVT3_9AGAM|nr:galactose-binding domain-like protein [Boletus reticuloceps]